MVSQFQAYRYVIQEALYEQLGRKHNERWPSKHQYGYLTKE